MNLLSANLFRAFVVVVSLAVMSGSAFARVQFPVAKAYEDTVRILILYNLGATATSVCPDLPPVGTQTMQFVKDALDTSSVLNVKTAPAHLATVANVRTAFGVKPPHAVVHVNAGWGSLSGNNMKAILQWCLDNNVGVVEVGDDDMLNLAAEFPWAYVIDMWAPMVTGGWLNKADDRLYLVLDASRDTWVDGAVYPNLNGIVRNAGTIAGKDTLQFKPIGAQGRCEADPDVIGFGLQDQGKVNFLAYQQGYNAAYDTGANGVQGSGDGDSAKIIGAAWSYCAVTILQDTLTLVNGRALRRAVSLSMQPQFLQNADAARHIVYDAIMYSSLVHTQNPPPPFDPVGIRQGRVAPRYFPKETVPPGAAIRVTDFRGRTVLSSRAGLRDRGAPGSAEPHSGVYVVSTVGSRLPARIVLGNR